jgi:hypothetical protein
MHSTFRERAFLEAAARTSGQYANKQKRTVEKPPPRSQSWNLLVAVLIG